MIKSFGHFRAKLGYPSFLFSMFVERFLDFVHTVMHISGSYTIVAKKKKEIRERGNENGLTIDGFRGLACF